MTTRGRTYVEQCSIADLEETEAIFQRYDAIPYDCINPEHYRAANGMESIDVIEAFVPDKPYRWPALKYLFRAGRKPGQDEVQDLHKAIWWIEREIASIEKTRQTEFVARHTFEKKYEG